MIAMKLTNRHHSGTLTLLLLFELSALSVNAATVVSTFQVGSGLWSASTNWTNSPFLGGFPNDGNAGIATYDAIVPSGSVTIDTNIVIERFIQSGGTVGGSMNLTANQLHTWTSGTLSGSGTNFDAGGLAVTGTVSLVTRQLQELVAATLAGGSVHLSSGGTISNLSGVAFSITDDSAIFNDGGAPAPVFSNAGTLDKTGAGNGISGAGAGVSRIDAPLTNPGLVRASAGTLQINGVGVTTGTLAAQAGARLMLSGNYLLDGATWSGAGTGEVSSSTTTLSNNVTATVAYFVHSGGTLGGPGNLSSSSAYKWTSGTESGSGTSTLSGPLSIIGTVSLNGRLLEPRGSASLAGGSLHLASGGTVSNMTGVAFSITDDSAIFNDGGVPTPVFQNVGTLDKTGAGNGVGGAGVGVSRLDAPLINPGLVRASAGTLQINGAGVTTGTLAAQAGARLLLSGIYTLDGATWSGSGTGEVSSGITTLSNNVTATVAYFVHSGGTLGGPGNLASSSAYKWTSGTESGSGTSTLSGPLSIIGTVSLNGRLLQPQGSASLSGGSLHLASGGTVSNMTGAAFSITDDSAIFNDGGAPTPLFLNAGTVDKTGAGNGISGSGLGVSRIDAQLMNQGTVRASAGTLQINGAGVTTGTLAAQAGARLLLSGIYTLDGATWSGSGTGEVSNGTTTLSNNVTATIANFVHSGGTLGGSGNLTSSSAYKWTSGTESGNGTSTLSGPLSIVGTVSLNGRLLDLQGSATLSGGSLHVASGATVSNLSGVTFSITDDSAIFNDGGAPTPLFLNAGMVDKTGAGNGISGSGLGVSRIDAQLMNQGTVRASAGTVQINGAGVTTGTLAAQAGARLMLSGSYTLDGAIWSGSGTGEVSSGTTTLSNTVTATVANFVHSGGTLGGPGNLASSSAYKWTSGTGSGNGTSTLSGPLSIVGTVSLVTRRLQSQGSATLAGGSLHMSSGAVLENQAPSSFNIVDDSSIFNDGLSPSILNLGTLLKSGSGNGISGAGIDVSRIDVPLTNNGTVSAQSGTLDFTTSYIQTAGFTVVTGGVISASNPIDIQGGSVIGTGIIVANLTNNGTISPGFSPGVLHFQGNVTCRSNSVIVIEIGGTTQGTNYDWVDITNAAILAGNLQVSFVNGYQTNISASAAFTVLKAGGSLAGAFNNVASGSRITTTDGFGSFLVTYTPATKTVVLSNFSPTPAPIPDFSANPTNGTVPLAVTFSNLTVGPVVGYVWNFGDGTMSAAANPVHTYTNSGTYTVTLAAYTLGGTNTATKANFIAVTPIACNLTITCPTNLIVSTSPGLCAATNVTYLVSFSDSCPGAVLSQVAGLPSGSTFPKGTTTNTFVVTDAYSNTVNCGFTVTVIDTEPPVVNCPANIVRSADPGQCSASNVTFAVTVTDNCPGAFVVCVPSSGSTFPKGVTLVNCVATDAAGNTNACSFTVTVIDTQPPTITSPTNIVRSTDPGQCSASNVTFAVTTTDNCPGTVVVCTPASGSTFPKGVTLVNCVATDAAGNTNACSFTVTVIDNQPPTITCPTNIVRSTDPGQCSASNVVFAVTANDNCPGTVVVCTPASGSTFPKGVTLVNCVATDAAGNTNACSFTVTVIDTQPPTITCPTNIVRSTDPGQCSASNVTFAVTVNDNCPGTLVVCTPPSGSTFPKGVTLVNCVATDAAGNTNACSFTVTVIDTEAPKVNCSSNIIVKVPAGQNNAIVNYPAPMASDNCPNVAASCAPPSGSLFPLGVTPVTCTAVDAAGNSNTCVFTVTVTSTNTPPAISCPGNIVTNNAPGQCAQLVAFATSVSGNPAPTVKCMLGTNIINSPYSFPVGTNTVVCTASNAAGQAVCMFTVTVLDTEAPTINCPTNIVRATDPGQCSASNVIFAVTANDNCPGTTVVCTPRSGSTFPKGVTLVNCVATDAAGNTNACSFTVTVIDTQPPSIICPTNIARLTDPGQCSASNVTFVVLVNDNCPGATLLCTPPSGTTFPKGVTIVNCVATDAAGNTNQCSFTVTVKDTQPPTIICPTNVVQSTDPGQCSSSNVMFAVTVADDCPGTTIVCTPPSGSTFQKGVTLVNCVATDTSGNTNACSFTVTIIDTQPPAITCSSNIIANAPAGQNSVVVNYAAPTATDNCPNVRASCAPPSGSLFPVGVTAVTCTAVDAAGNSNTCVFTVTVTATNANTAPTIACPGNLITNNAPGQCSRVLAFATTVSGSPAPTVTCKIGGNVVTSPYAFPVGTNVVVCTASNVAGNAVCMFTVIVLDTEPPVITCPPNMVVAAPMGQLGTNVNFVVSAVDNCDGAVPVVCVPKPGYFAVGQTIVTCMAVDRAGNSNVCVFVVTVTAPAAPARPCTLTQGFYGHPRRRFNGQTSLALVRGILNQGPVVVGKAGLRSLTILPGDEALLEERLPSDGPPAMLPNNGDQTLADALLPLNRKGRFANELLGQTLTLSLNGVLNAALLSVQLTSNSCSQAVHAGPDGIKGTDDDATIAHDTQSIVISGEVLLALQDPNVGINNNSVAGLLKLANNALAGLPIGAASFHEITEALEAINRGFDECRMAVPCSSGTPNPDSFNDDFDARPRLDLPPPPSPLLNVRVRGSNLTASKELGEPDIAGNPGGKSLWWQWLSPVSGPVSVSTIGSSFDTLLGVYTGTALSNLVLVASNDDAQGSLQSELSFQAVAGTSYQIAVDGYDGASGEVVLTLVSAPVRFCQPVTVSGTQVQFCLKGEIGETYSIEASPDMVNWTLVATAVNTNGLVVFNDPGMNNFQQRFYKVSLDP